MAESGNRRTRTDRSDRPRSGSSSAGRGASRGASSGGLLELADQIEEHGRALLARARDLRRMAESGTGSSGRSTGTRSGGYGGNRAEEGSRPQRRTSERGGSSDRPRSSRGGTGERSRGKQSDRDETPDWAPTPKKRRT